ncbi:type I methionyl aminopeptidase [Paenibacillus sp. CAA11]|uniref:type I methionyl aminopeptidase n=1 Tax=Paenibacillus sp. CAA11 TaxID=1532905 RepID=UPI000D33EC2A|nr:type I methionyl aminopeptidase [Paenibacillus sp. CAA11]AWB44530.1 type I methionyl aminopeptidase [Paenibacillus sp. CAA11]
MIVKSEEDVRGLKEIGSIVAKTIHLMKELTKPGMTTKELDEIGGKILAEHGAFSAPMRHYNFPGHACISVNQEVAHGIPGNRVLKPGDLVNIDVTAEKNGYVADSGYSFQLPPADSKITDLCDFTHQTMMKVISSLRAGVRLNEVGRIIEAEAKRGGYTVIENLCSHGVGRAIHESPKQILPTYEKGDTRVLKEGQVITIEPFLAIGGAEYVVEELDGWTLTIPEHCFAAQFEHSIIITKEDPIILTAYEQQ